MFTEADIRAFSKDPLGHLPVLKYLASPQIYEDSFKIEEKLGQTSHDQAWRAEIHFAERLWVFHFPSRTWRRAQVDGVQDDKIRVLYDTLPIEDARWFARTSRFLKKVDIEYEEQYWRLNLVIGSKCDVFFNGNWHEATVYNKTDEIIWLEVEKYGMINEGLRYLKIVLEKNKKRTLKM